MVSRKPRHISADFQWSPVFGVGTQFFIDRSGFAGTVQVGRINFGLFLLRRKV